MNFVSFLLLNGGAGLSSQSRLGPSPLISSWIRLAGNKSAGQNISCKQEKKKKKFGSGKKKDFYHQKLFLFLRKIPASNSWLLLRISNLTSSPIVRDGRSRSFPVELVVSDGRFSARLSSRVIVGVQQHCSHWFWEFHGERVHEWCWAGVERSFDRRRGRGGALVRRITSNSYFSIVTGRPSLIPAETLPAR